jgi:hypothetical protein
MVRIDCLLVVLVFVLVRLASAGRRWYMPMPLTVQTVSPFWLLATHWVITTPRSGFELDGRASRTFSTAVSVSPA